VWRVIVKWRGNMMRKVQALVVLAALGGSAAFGTPVHAQTAAAGDAVLVDHSVRASRLIGQQVYNEQDQSFGMVEDIVIPAAAGKEPLAVLSVGKFVGGHKLIAVPLSHLSLSGAHMAMAGGSRDSLMTMPAYHFPALEGNGQG
jgi:hypothetical protein